MCMMARKRPHRKLEFTKCQLGIAYMHSLSPYNGHITGEKKKKYKEANISPVSHSLQMGKPINYQMV